MKFSKNNMINKTIIIFAALCTVTGSTNAMDPLLRYFKEKSLEQPENMWLEISGGQRTTIPTWQIDKMKVFPSLSIAQKKQNDYHNPIDASMVTNTSLMLIENALNKAKNREDFNMFYKDLTSDQKTELANTAVTLKVIELGALSPEIHEKLWQTNFKHSALLSKEILDQLIITLPSKNILNQRLNEYGFTYINEKARLADNLGGLTAPAGAIIMQIAAMLNNVNEKDSVSGRLTLMERPEIIELILQDNPHVINILKK